MLMMMLAMASTMMKMIIAESPLKQDMKRYVDEQAFKHCEHDLILSKVFDINH